MDENAEVNDSGAAIVNGSEFDWKTMMIPDEEIKASGDSIVAKKRDAIRERGRLILLKFCEFFKKTRKMIKNNIPSVRSNGKMTARSNNWEPLGTKSVSIDGSSGGPFRNIKLF